VIGSGVVFCEIIGSIGVTRLPEDVKLALAGMIMQPVKPHVDGFGPFLFDCVIEYASCHAVVSLQGGGWLWVP